ncbi:hypothetical protein E2C01_076982 [Portunus trituberculatus]|uniref:Uncharacterized protein n=1 Tax=Portunus trituberculatus TaxID=210409 RepID=A0A5B7IQ32_PORTR|nr:hypothetical protein [Portunus trituberculatus]
MSRNMTVVFTPPRSCCPRQGNKPQM